MLSQLATDPSLSLEHQDSIFAVAYIHVEAEAAFQAQYVCALALASAATDDVDCADAQAHYYHTDYLFFRGHV